MEIIRDADQGGCAFILYDTAVAARHEIASWFEMSGGFAGESGGRQAPVFFSAGGEEFVLKRYRRGGLPARLSERRYFYTRREAVRSFVEWRVLYQLRQRGLSVPVPVAARYRRRGLFYTAELITRSCRPAQPLAKLLAEHDLDVRIWTSVGLAIRRFHNAGISHPDLNAYNVLLDGVDESSSTEVILVDFDRASLRRAGHRRQLRNLRRLHRSLLKLRRLNPGFRFTEDRFEALLQAWSPR